MLVLRALTDKTQVGTVEADAEGKVTVIQGGHKTVEDGNSTSVSVEAPDELSRRPESPFKPGPSAMPLRVADLVCEELQQLEGIPRFQKQWTLAKRDEAIAATMAYLKQYGERFRENAASRAIRAAEPGDPQHEKAILAFDPLDHPATADDVAAGRAIFSLDGAGAEVRRFPLPSFPIEARWTKLEVFPNDPPIMRMYDAEGHELPNTEGLQTGRVWQAEEVREGDRWRRYYGFVGRHALTRVAAEEIEFLTPWQPGLVVALDRPGRPDRHQECRDRRPAAGRVLVPEPPRGRDDGPGRSRPRSRRRAHDPRGDRLPARPRVGQARRSRSVCRVGRRS